MSEIDKLDYLNDDNISVKSIYNFSYNYAGNSPLTYFDAYGLYPQDQCGIKDGCKKICELIKENKKAVVFCILCGISEKKPPPPPPKPPIPTLPRPSDPDKK